MLNDAMRAKSNAESERESKNESAKCKRKQTNTDVRHFHSKTFVGRFKKDLFGVTSIPGPVMGARRGRRHGHHSMTDHGGGGCSCRRHFRPSCATSCCSEMMIPSCVYNIVESQRSPHHFFSAVRILFHHSGRLHKTVETRKIVETRKHSVET